MIVLVVITALCITGILVAAFLFNSVGDREQSIHLPEKPEEQPTEEVALADANGRVIGDYLYLYPPGVPILVPGEVIQMKHIENIQNYLSQGLEVHGGYLKENGNVKVILHHG